MQIVIDIDEEIIKDAKDSPNYYPTYHFEKIWKAIVNGTPLPKGHGRLIDESEIDWLTDNSGKKFTFEERVKNTSPTIIEADKAESEVNNG